MAASAKGFSVAGGLAHGGNAFAGKTYLIGEKGPELLTMGSNGFVTPNRGIGGAGSVVIENVIITVLPNATNAQALLDMDANEMREVVAGPIIDALNRLDQQGIRPNANERRREG